MVGIGWGSGRGSAVVVWWRVVGAREAVRGGARQCEAVRGGAQGSVLES